MPNWASCKLSAIGRSEDLQQFRERTYSLDLEAEAPDERTHAAIDCEKIVPFPVGVDMHAAERGGTTPRWYWWCVKHWGTKWNTVRRRCGMIIPHPTGTETCSLTCTFLSAYGPPIKCVHKLVDDWPMLDLRLACSLEGWDDSDTVIASTNRLTVKGKRELDVQEIPEVEHALFCLKEFGWVPTAIKEGLPASLGDPPRVEDMAHDLNGIVEPHAQLTVIIQRWHELYDAGQEIAG